MNRIEITAIQFALTNLVRQAYREHSNKTCGKMLQSTRLNRETSPFLLSLCQSFAYHPHILRISSTFPLVFLSTSSSNPLPFRSSTVFLPLPSQMPLFSLFFLLLLLSPPSIFNSIDFQIRQSLVVQNSFASFRFNRCDYSNQYTHERQLNRSKVLVFFTAFLCYQHSCCWCLLSFGRTNSNRSPKQQQIHPMNHEKD